MTKEKLLNDIFDMVKDKDISKLRFKVINKDNSCYGYNNRIYDRIDQYSIKDGVLEMKVVIKAFHSKKISQLPKQSIQDIYNILKGEKND